MSYQLMFQKAVELQQNGALNEAEQIYRQILETAPENADVWNLLGLIAQSKGIHNEAVSCFYKAAEYAPQHFPVFFNLGISLGALGKDIEAAEAYRKALEIKPDCKEARLALGNLYWHKNELEKAKTEFAKALEIDTDYLPARTNSAEINDDEKTLEKIAQNNPQALYYLGRRSARKGDFSGAEAKLQEADQLSESDEIKALLGECLTVLGEKKAALSKFYQAYNLNNHNYAAVINIADLEAENHNFKEAECFYKRAAELNFSDVRAHANYAEMLYQNKRTVEALEEYRQAVIIAPEMPELSYNLAVILKDLQEYEQALDLMFYAFYKAPQHEDWSFNIAETLVLLNENAPEKARKICENWYEKMPENIVVKHLWASINHKESETDKEYNRLLFDNFAGGYEQTLKNINYAVVDKISELYAPLKGKILDLGCGTGLLAEKLKTDDNEFVGVDISAKMLAIAKEKQVYKELQQADIIEYSANNKTEFDYVTAADVFCYFGDLKKIIKQCFPCCLIFSVETAEKVEKYELQANGRYKHNLRYVRELLSEAGYDDLAETEIVLRCENGKDVKGGLFRATKKG